MAEQRLKGCRDLPLLVLSPVRGAFENAAALETRGESKRVHVCTAADVHECAHEGGLVCVWLGAERPYGQHKYTHLTAASHLSGAE